MPKLELCSADLRLLHDESPIVFSPRMSLGQGPQRAIAYLESVMLSPRNDTDRTKFYDNLIAAKISDKLRADANRVPAARPFSNKQISALADVLATAPRQQEVHKERSRRCLQGTAAGLILWEGLVARDRGQETGLSKIKADIADVLQRKGKKRGPSVSFLDNVLWQTFRPVAHLWLASLLRELAKLAPDNAGAPCTPGDLIRFLAIAERLRLDGEAARFWKSNQPLLHPNYTWKVPSNIRLPRLAIRYSAEDWRDRVTEQRPDSIAGAFWSSAPRVSRIAFEEALGKKVALATVEAYPCGIMGAPPTLVRLPRGPALSGSRQEAVSRLRPPPGYEAGCCADGLVWLASRLREAAIRSPHSNRCGGTTDATDTAAP
jgi:hypothetical protein